MFNTRTKLFFFAYLKYTTGAALKNAAPAQTKKYLLRLRSRPNSGGSRQLRLRNTGTHMLGYSASIFTTTYQIIDKNKL